MDSPASRICHAHAANVAITAAVGARDMTNMVHEVLGPDLDIGTYPFVPLSRLANQDARQCGDAEQLVLGIWTGLSDTVEAQRNDRDDASCLKNMECLGGRGRRALDRAAAVFTDNSARVVYLRDVWPYVTKDLKWNKKRDKEVTIQERSKMVHMMDQWCAHQGFTVDDMI